MFNDPNVPPMPPIGPNPVEAPISSPAVQKFHTCRWRRPPEDHSTLDYCSHRDVLPMAGTTGFDPAAWCPDCSFYKLRRTPRKRPVDDYHY